MICEKIEPGPLTAWEMSWLPFLEQNRAAWIAGFWNKFEAVMPEIVGMIGPADVLPVQAKIELIFGWVRERLDPTLEFFKGANIPRIALAVHSLNKAADCAEQP